MRPVAPAATDAFRAPAALLQSHPLLLIFEDFEQNLTAGGGHFTDPAFEELFTTWCRAADVGAILVTSR